MHIILGILGLGTGAILFLIAIASANNNAALLAESRYLLPIAIAISLSLLVVTLFSLYQTLRSFLAKEFGVKFNLKLIFWFSIFTIIPGLLIYGLSYHFISKSIDTWFDVRVEKAIESSLIIAKSALTSITEELKSRGNRMAFTLNGHNSSLWGITLPTLRAENEIHAAGIYTRSKKLVAYVGQDLSPQSKTPQSSELQSVRVAVPITKIVDSGNGSIEINVFVAIEPNMLDINSHVLMVSSIVPSQVASHFRAVETTYSDYKDIQNDRNKLKQLYLAALSVSLLLVLALASSIALSVAKRFARPLLILAEGTVAVAQGDYSQRPDLPGNDEISQLIRSFNWMTSQLNLARSEAERHRNEVEAARLFLEQILANLSAGVLVLSHQFILRECNLGARKIMLDDFKNLLGEGVETWPRLQQLGRAVRDGFANSRTSTWQQQIELIIDQKKPRTLLLRGSTLTAISAKHEKGYIVVFDDISDIIIGQRSAAWAEIAQRLAHEIKNPLTPIRLSAERMQRRLTDKLSHDEDALALLNKASKQIIKQVIIMKSMVDEFRNYARLPAPVIDKMDINYVIDDTLNLYEAGNVDLEAHLHTEPLLIMADAAQLRQILINLIKNAEEATALNNDVTPKIRITSYAQNGWANITIEDNGNAFASNIIDRAFEPYVTTKSTGTGLGLAIVKKLVDEQEGKISLEHSTALSGAMVRLCFPLAHDAT